MKKTNLYISIFFAFLFPLIVNASSQYKPQISDPILELWRWSKIPELSSMGVQCMIEVDKNLVWFGTSNGIKSYDGGNWRTYSHEDGLVGFKTLCLLKAFDNSIYSGSESGISIYKNGGWKRFFPMNEKTNIYIYQITQFSDGSLWASTDRGAFRFIDNIIYHYYNPKLLNPLENENVVPVKIGGSSKLIGPQFYATLSVFQVSENTAWIFSNQGEVVEIPIDINPIHENEVKIYTKKDGVNVGDLPKVFIKNSNEIWIINDTYDQGISVFNVQNKTWKNFKLSQLFHQDDVNTSIMRISDDNVWIGGHGAIFTLHNDQWKIYKNTQIPIPNARLYLLQLSDGSIIVAGRDSDVFRLDYTFEKWSSYENINFQCETSDGKKWFLAKNGSVISHNPFTNGWVEYTVDDGLIDTPISVNVTSKDVIFVVGSHEIQAASSFFINSSWKNQIYPTLSWGIYEHCVLETPNGSIWLGAVSETYEDQYDGGLIEIFNPGNHEIRYEHHKGTKTGKLSPAGLALGPDGFIWMAGVDISIYNGNEWKKIKSKRELETEWIDDILNNSQGDLWAIKGGIGLFRKKRNSENWELFTIQDGLSSNMVADIAFLDDGSVIAATSEGISRLIDSTWITHALPYDFKIDRENGTIKQSNNGDIWINTASRRWFQRAIALNQNNIDIAPDFGTVRYRKDNEPPNTIITTLINQVSVEGNINISWDGVDIWHRTPKNKLQYSYKLDNESWSQFSSKTNRTFFSILSGDHTLEIRSRDTDLNIDPTPASIQFYVQTPIWKQWWFIILSTSLLVSIVMFVALFINRKIKIQNLAAEKEHELDLMRVRFYQNISHEFRTPLTLIMGPLKELLDNEKMTKQLKVKFELMYRNAQRLLRLVNQVLDFRKIEAGTLSLKASKANIIDSLKIIVESFRLLAIQQNIKLEFQSNFDSYFLWFDEDKLDKVIYNLLSNAFKFTPNGGNVTVMISENNNLFNIDVIDTGPGIPNEQIDYIFNRFYKIEHKNIKNVEGAGIGLALSRELIQLHHGEILVNNREDIGAKFTVCLPIGEDHLSESEKLDLDEDEIDTSSAELVGDEIEILEKENAGSEIMHLLIVDDYPDIRNYLSSELGTIYKTDTASSGEQALEKALKTIPDLIISDVVMGELDGIELCAQLKSNEMTNDIPIILVTARTSEESKLKGINSGADDYITKPFNLKLLKAKINNLLTERKILREKFSREIFVGTSQIETSQIKDSFIIKSIEIIDAHLSDPDFCIEQFCREVAVSRTQLFRKFKSSVSLTPAEFIKIIRLKRAESLILSSDLSITQICYEVGFKYPSHFSQMFNSQFGMSPKDYKKLNFLQNKLKR